MRYGARVPDMTKWGRDYYFKHDDIAAFLMERGMNPEPHELRSDDAAARDGAARRRCRRRRLLLDHGAAIDAVDDEFRSTPLGLAARWGRREMVALLLSRGADPNAAGAPWATPLTWARRKGHDDVAADLRRAGASE